MIQHGHIIISPENTHKFQPLQTIDNMFKNEFHFQSVIKLLGLTPLSITATDSPQWLAADLNYYLQTLCKLIIINLGLLHSTHSALFV